MYKLYFKPIFDFVIAFILLLFFSPIILLTFLLLFFVNRGKVLFLQVRPGYQCQPFVIIKFKTMKDDYDIDGNLLPDEDRLTFIGEKIRALSIDELLQLLNVLRGEMSLVGPRPLLTKYLTRYNSEQIKRHDVKPGITGWAQVNGRNAICWDEKFRLDLEYVEKVSLWIDLKILWMTIINVIKKKGISADGQATMGEFMG
jgi:lipopolysaccharide/colanic/teichoic acid biosynthesis glycosyltransferase